VDPLGDPAPRREPRQRRRGRPFLCEAFALTRWFHPIRQTGYLPLSHIAANVPADSQLPSAGKEWEDLQTLAGEGRQVERIPARTADVMAAFRSRAYDGWHFTGHGLFRGSAPDLSAIHLEGGDRITPADLAGEAKTMGIRRPLVFLNACDTGRSGLSLTDVGGWAVHFVRAGSGAFLGTLWEVRDSKSRDFARAFYTSLIGGLPLAEAVQAARQAIRSEDDPTWLAYTVFGHPRTVCRPVPGRGGEAV
jgi:CHAT domain-containing protein